MAESNFDDAAFVRDFDTRTLTQEFLDNPYPYYRALRDHDPVHLCPDGSYFLTRYQDVSAVYRDPRMSSDKKLEFKEKFGDGPLYDHHTTSLVFNDPPLHTRVRKLLAAAFTPRALQAMTPRIVALVDGFLDVAEDAGRMDLIGDFAFALPVEVICEMLGVPRHERAPLRDWSLAILGALEPTISMEALVRGNRAVEDFLEFLRRLVAARKRNLRDDDILSTLIVGKVDGVGLSDDELLQNCIFILNAGHETTTNLIGNGINALLENPDELRRLRDNPELIDTAIEEFLRYESSNQLGNRLVASAAEIGGVEMPAGTRITMCIGAANRDPDEFNDPERLDIGRAPNRHLAFGAGPHICLGNSLARIESRVAIGALLARFPKMRPDGALVRGGRARFRGFRSNRSRFDVARGEVISL